MKKFKVDGLLILAFELLFVGLYLAAAAILDWTVVWVPAVTYVIAASVVLELRGIGSRLLRAMVTAAIQEQATTKAPPAPGLGEDGRPAGASPLSVVEPESARSLEPAAAAPDDTPTPQSGPTWPTSPEPVRDLIGEAVVPTSEATIITARPAG